MMPNIDPRQMKALMERMGMKQSEVEALRVIIEGRDADIVIESPQVTVIEMQGTRTFQIVGEERTVEKGKVEISDDDIQLVKEQTGIDDEERIRKALEETKGDIAAAIIKLKES